MGLFERKPANGVDPSEGAPAPEASAPPPQEVHMDADSIQTSVLSAS